MSIVHTRNTFIQRIQTAVADAWQAGVSSDLYDGWRLVRVTVELEGDLSSQVRWESNVPTAYSLVPGSDVETLGLGSARVIEAFGQETVSDVQRQMAAMRIPPGIRWFGAFSFDSTIPPQGVWEQWPNSVWFCPTLTLTHAIGEHTVEVNFFEAHGRDAHDIKTIIAALFAGVESEASSHETAIADESTWLQQAGKMMSEDEWAKLVHDALLEIRSGQLEKVVVARQTAMPVGAQLSETLRRLMNAYATSHVFAMQWHGQWLVGASPEQLIRVDDGVLRVDCLAGSTDRGDTEANDKALANALLTSHKNRAEHAAVVHFVTQQLETVAEALEFADVPMMKKLANVQHLYTPITGRLLPDRHLLDAASLLHPTPAVAGVPRPPAMQFIRDREEWARGYYAGAFGCIESSGDGLLSVALRTALVNYPDAVLFAGCGIVEGSVDADEWTETELKLKPMRTALK